MNEFETYKAEAREKWGETEAYKEHEKKTNGYSKDKWNSLADGMNCILSEFATCMQSGNKPDSDSAQALVKKLKDHITENYYTCTDDILAGLGQMYVADERFKKNIDKHADGNAEFISEAIALYCNK